MANAIFPSMLAHLQQLATTQAENAAQLRNAVQQLPPAAAGALYQYVRNVEFAAQATAGLAATFAPMVAQAQVDVEQACIALAGHPTAPVLVRLVGTPS